MVFSVLNPSGKLAYFKKHWSADLQEDIVRCAEEVVSAHTTFLSSEELTLDVNCSLKKDGYL